jgi:hypothetical protein
MAENEQVIIKAAAYRTMEEKLAEAQTMIWTFNWPEQISI